MQQFNDSVRQSLSLEIQNEYLEQIRSNLPESMSELKASFEFMINEGLIMNFSLLI